MSPPYADNPLDIVAVHATILSIFIGTVSAYVLYVFGSIDQMKTQIYYEAHRINSFCFGHPHWLSTEYTILVIDDQKREDLLEDFEKIFMGRGVRSRGITTSLEKGEAILRIITALSFHYPFSTRSKRDTDGNISWGKTIPIHFNTVDQVRKWISDIDLIIGAVSWVKDAHRQIIQQYLDSISNDGKWDYIVDEFIKGAHDIEDLSISVKHRIANYEAYISLLPQRKIIVKLIIFTVITFFSGVIIPLFFKEVPQLFILWIPMFFYIYIFSGGIFWMLKRYRDQQ